ncbi:MAG: hypothetical protein WD825_04400 [Gemmatimonadaceae bacterium]
MDGPNRDGGSLSIAIRTARTVVAVRLIILAILFGAFALFAWVMLPPKYALWGVAAVIMTWLYLVRSLLRIFVTGTAFVLTDRGLLAHVGSVDFVAWEEIEDARIAMHGAVEGIDLDVNDVEAVVARLSVVRRALLRSHIRQGGKLGLAASFGVGGAEYLLELIRQRINLREGDVAKPARARYSLETSESEGGNDNILTKPFARMFAIAAVVYAVGLGIALYVYRRRDWDWDTPLFALIALAALIVSFGILPLYTGEVQLRNSTFYRGKNPIMYWGAVAMIVGLGVVLFLVGIGVVA